MNVKPEKSEIALFMGYLLVHRYNLAGRQVAIAEFATRAHLQIRIKPNKAKNRKIQKKAMKIINLIQEKINLSEDLKEELSNELFKIL